MKEKKRRRRRKKKKETKSAAGARPSGCHLGPRFSPNYPEALATSEVR
jgi:hypothetical protein